MARKTYSASEKAAHAETRKAKLTAAHDLLVEGVKRITSGDDWKRMLDVAAKFHTYSFGNTLLIAAQCPQAARVAGYKTWLSVGRQVRKGETGISILAPNTFKSTDDDGEEHFGIRGFRVTSVFDVSQTDGDPLPDVGAKLLQGDDLPVVWAQIAAQIEAFGYTIERGDCGGANGYTQPINKTVRVRADVSGAQALKTLCHELAHIQLGHTEGSNYACRGRCEVEAESVAYLVADAVGLVSDDYSFPYVAGWAEGSLDAVRETADAVVEAAHIITKDLVS